MPRSRGMVSFRGMIPGFIEDAKRKATRIMAPSTFKQAARGKISCCSLGAHCESPRNEFRSRPAAGDSSKCFEENTRPNPCEQGIEVPQVTGHLKL